MSEIISMIEANFRRVCEGIKVMRQSLVE